MCERWCGDRNREHEPNDGVILYCRTCADMVSQDFLPFRDEDWDRHVAKGGEHERHVGNDSDQIDTKRPVGGYSVGDRVTFRDEDDGWFVGTITGFATIGDQGFIALAKSDDGRECGTYVEYMDRV